MRSEYEAFLTDANTNPTPIGSREERERQERMWIFRDYLREHGRYPIAPIRIENGQIVEVTPTDQPIAAAP